jgi:small subunit ribosomal protein S6
VTAVRVYETMLLLRPEQEEEQVTATVERIQGIIQADGGEMKNVDRWGKRRLAYEVNNQHEGIYLVLTFTSGPAALKEMNRVLGLAEEVLRHFTIRKEE